MKKTAIYDFAIILAAALAALLLFRGLGWFLYGNELSVSGVIHLSTGELDSRFDGLLNIGDEVYDTVTKRRIGEIISLEKTYTERGVKYEIALDAIRSPAGHPIRTKLLWLECTDENVESACTASKEPGGA